MHRSATCDDGGFATVTPSLMHFRRHGQDMRWGYKELDSAMRQTIHDLSKGIAQSQPRGGQGSRLGASRRRRFLWSWTSRAMRRRTSSRRRVRRCGPRCSGSPSASPGESRRSEAAVARVGNRSRAWLCASSSCSWRRQCQAASRLGRRLTRWYRLADATEPRGAGARVPCVSFQGGDAGGRPELEREGRAECRPEITAQALDLDATWCRMHTFLFEEEESEVPGRSGISKPIRLTSLCACGTTSRPRASLGCQVCSEVPGDSCRGVRAARLGDPLGEPPVDLPRAPNRVEPQVVPKYRRSACTHSEVSIGAQKRSRWMMKHLSASTCMTMLSRTMRGNSESAIERSGQGVRWLCRWQAKLGQYSDVCRSHETQS